MSKRIKTTHVPQQIWRGLRRKPEIYRLNLMSFLLEHFLTQEHGSLLRYILMKSKNIFRHFFSVSVVQMRKTQSKSKTLILDELLKRTLRLHPNTTSFDPAVLSHFIAKFCTQYNHENSKISQ